MINRYSASAITVSLTEPDVTYLMDFLAKHPERAAMLNEKIGIAIRGLIEQEQYEIGVMNYWNKRNKVG